MKTLILISLVLAPLYGAAITSTQTGDWNVTTTWAGGVIPASGDTVTISTGHTVTVPPGYTATVGTSTGSTDLTCSGGGSLVVAGVLNYRGNVSCGNLTAAGGAQFVHDSHLAPTQHYFFDAPSSCAHTTCAWALSGGAGRITWGIAASSGAAGHVGANVTSSADGPSITVTNVDWSDIGTAGGNSIQAALFTAGNTVSIHNSTCNPCGTVYLGQVVSGTTLSVNNFIVSSTAGANGDGVFIRMDDVMTSGTREFINSYVENAKVNLYCTSLLTPHLTFTGNTLYNTLGVVTFPGTVPCEFASREWKNNLLWVNGPSGSYLPAGEIGPSFQLSSVSDTCTGENFHSISTSLYDSTFTGWILEPDCGTRTSTFGGKTFVDGGSAATHAISYRFTGIISLPATAGLAGAAGTGTTGPGSPIYWNALTCDGTTTFCPKITVDHSTAYASDVGVFYSTEINTTQPVVVEGAKDNIIWRGSSGASGKIDMTGHTLPNGSILGAKNNWKYNDDGTGVQYETRGGNVEYASPSTPGTGDTSGNPQFVDPTRNFIKWCQTINPADTTWAQCFAHFKDVHAVANGYSPAKLIASVKAGFVPTNTATGTASSTGGQVGALPYASVQPVMFYSDLTGGPKTGGLNNNGVFVTVNGKRFGATQGSLSLGGQNAVIISWADTKIVFQPGSSAPAGLNTITVTRSDGEQAACSQDGNCDFTVRSGNIYCVSNTGSNGNSGVFTGPASNCWATLVYAGAHLAAGDTLILGKSSSDNYQSEDRTQTYVSDTAFSLRPDAVATGTAANPIAMVGYPGATATVGGANGNYGHYGIWGSSSHAIQWWTFANFTVIAGHWNGFADQGYGTFAFATEGFPGLRIINLDLQNPIAYIGGGLNVVKTLATPTSGKVTWLYGNYVHNIQNPTPGYDTKRTAMVYIGSDGNEVEAAWNRIDDADAGGRVNRCFHVHSSPFFVAQQVDGFRIYGLSVHDNLIANCGGNGIDATVDPSIGTGVQIVNNTYDNVANCPNWEGEESAYTVFNFGESGASADFNWTPGSGTVKIHNNTVNNSGYCPTFPTGAVFSGAAYFDGTSGELQPPARVLICSSCATASYSGTLPVTMYTPHNYFPRTVTFVTLESVLSRDQAVIDDGLGNLTQEGSTIGTINYDTGAYSFTLLRTPVNADVWYHTTGAYRVSLKNNVFNLFANQQWQLAQYDMASLYSFGGDHNLFRSVTYTGGPVYPLHFTSSIGSNPDPMFVSSSDFHLQTGSPAISAGVATGVLRDIEGRIRMTNDAGAYAYTGLLSCSITPASGGPYTAGQVVSSPTFVASNCTSSTWGATGLSGSGLSLNSSTGALSGTAVAGSYSVTITYDTASNPFTMTINAAPSGNKQSFTSRFSGRKGK